MSDKIPARTKPASPGKTPPRARRAQHQRQRTLIVGGVILGVSIVGFAAVMANLSARSIRPSLAIQATNTPPGNDFRSAKIVTESVYGERCPQRRFDNQTGSMVDDNRPCDNVTVLDSNGVPVPLGTVHRLDGISKSFSNR
jgi:hypothetical protein